MTPCDRPSLQTQARWCPRMVAKRVPSSWCLNASSQAWMFREAETHEWKRSRTVAAHTAKNIDRVRDNSQPIFPSFRSKTDTARDKDGASFGAAAQMMSAEQYRSRNCAASAETSTNGERPSSKTAAACSSRGSAARCRSASSKCNAWQSPVIRPIMVRVMVRQRRCRRRT